MDYSTERERRPTAPAGCSVESPGKALLFDPGAIVPRDWQKARSDRLRTARVRLRDRLAVARSVVNGFALFGIAVTAISLPFIFEFARSSRVVGLDVFEYSIDWILLFGLLAISVVVFGCGLVVLRAGMKWWARR